MGNKFNDETLIPTDYVYVVADKYGKSLVTDENGDFYSRPLQYYHVVVVSPLKPYLAYFIFDEKFTDDVELRCGKMETKDIYYCLSADEARHKDVTLKNKIEGNVALELNEFISKFPTTSILSPILYSSER